MLVVNLEVSYLNTLSEFTNSFTWVRNKISLLIIVFFLFLIENIDFY